MTFLLPLAVYWRTAYPTVHTLDVAEFATAAPTLGIVHSPGYPTYLLVARLALLLPHDEPVRLLNLLSGVAAAATVAALGLLIWRLTGRLTAAGGAALFFAFSHYQWTEAIIATPYTLNSLWLALDLLLLQRWRADRDTRALALFALLVGLQPGLHASVVLQLPAFGVLLLGTDARGLLRPRRLALLAGLFALGLSVWLYLPLRAAADPPYSFAREVGYDLTAPRDLWLYATSEVFREQLLGYRADRLATEVGRSLGWFWESLLGFGVVVSLLGWVAQFRRDRLLTLALSLGFALHFAFYATYNTLNRDTMFLPCYLLWTIWLGEGLAWALGRAAPTRHAALVAGMLLLPLLPLSTNFARVDASRDRSVRDLAEAVLSEARPGSLVLGHWLEITPLRYLSIVEGVRPDVELGDLSLRLLRRRRELAAGGLAPYGQALPIWQAETEREILGRLRAGQTVYLFQEITTSPDGWRYVREGPVLRAVLR